jgi:hypothetical protein
MTDETPGPQAPAEEMPFKAPAKARPYQTSKKPWKNRNTSFGRTEIINLAEAPDHFIQATGKNKGRILGPFRECTETSSTNPLVRLGIRFMITATRVLTGLASSFAERP